MAVPLLAVLSDTTIWGRDFPALLAYIESWTQAGEQTVIVFDDTIMGGIRRGMRDDAQRAVSALSAAFERPRRSPRAFAPTAVHRASQARPPFVAAVVVLSDDRTLHAGAVGPSLQLLAPSLTIEHVRRRLGAPDTVRRELIQTEREGRPTILTLHFFAAGAVIFAESDLAPRPGFVDRVFVDVEAVSRALFQEPR